MLKFATTETHLTVTGKTFHIKEKLKELTATWNPEEKSWSLPSALDTPSLRKELVELLPKREPPTKKKHPTQEELKAAMSEAYKSGKFWWICCEECEIVDYKRLHTYCKIHEFQVRGNKFTGD